jgi:hypothetical protein
MSKLNTNTGFNSSCCRAEIKASYSYDPQHDSFLGHSHEEYNVKFYCSKCATAFHLDEAGFFDPIDKNKVIETFRDYKVISIVPEENEVLSIPRNKTFHLTQKTTLLRRVNSEKFELEQPHAEKYFLVENQEGMSLWDLQENIRQEFKKRENAIRLELENGDKESAKALADTLGFTISLPEEHKGDDSISKVLRNSEAQVSLENLFDDFGIEPPEDAIPASPIYLLNPDFSLDELWIKTKAIIQ